MLMARPLPAEALLSCAIPPHVGGQKGLVRMAQRREEAVRSPKSAARCHSRDPCPIGGACDPG